MASSEGRRSFLLGITLNELSFIMFFLLMFISAATLQKTNNKLQLEIQKTDNLKAEFIKAMQDKDEVFKRLQLLETKLIRAGGFSSRPTEQELEQLFSKIQDVKPKDELQQLVAKLQSELEFLQQYKQLDTVIKESGLAEHSFQQIGQVLKQAKQSSQVLQSLKGRLAYSQKKLKNSGLGYPPCWADSKSGAVEYLYTITLYEHQMLIEEAWPEYRKGSLSVIPNVEKMVGKIMGVQEFRRLAKPILNWSQLNSCRHFVRINDDKNTSKEAFKKQMLAIEDYFYKYLVR